jgi:TorA-specific chaperone
MNRLFASAGGTERFDASRWLAQAVTSDPIDRTHATGHDARAVVVDWLACLFMAPLPIVAVADYRSTQGERLLEAIGDEMGCAPGIHRMRSALTFPGASTASLARELSITYTLLFEGVAGPRTASLHERSYIGADDRPFRLAIHDMETLLQRFGGIVRSGHRDPSDHLSIELALLSTVMRAADEDGVALLRDRLLGWVPAFSARCGRIDPIGFYFGAAMVLNAVLMSPAFRNAHGVA